MGTREGEPGGTWEASEGRDGLWLKREWPSSREAAADGRGGERAMDVRIATNWPCLSGVGGREDLRLMDGTW